MRDPRPGSVARIDLDRPLDGLVLPAAGDAPSDRLLGLDLRSTCGLADHWVRDGDVTAVYESTDTRRLRVTAMWRLHPSGVGTHAWVAMVSAQTALVNSDSFLAVVSDVDAESIAWGTIRAGAVHWRSVADPDATCVLLRRAGAGPDRASVLVAAHPGECRRITERRSGRRITVDCWLFSSALEKGVLLRSRILAATGPADDDTVWADAVATAFAAEPPMLST